MQESDIVDELLALSRSDAPAKTRSLARAAKSEITRLRALTNDANGWIVANADGTLWRRWDAGGPEWTSQRTEAVRYARRQDAEAVHAEDEDAWRVEPFGTNDAPVERLVEAAKRVLVLARNEGVATGSNGQVFWGQAIRDLEAALTTAPTAPVVPDREAIARVICPAAFTIGSKNRAHWREYALRRADAILSLIAARPGDTA